MGQPTPSATEAATAGAFAGGFTRLIAAPFDLIKIRFQVQTTPISRSYSEAKYVSFLQAIRSIYAEEGVRSFWRGNLAATILWISYSSIQFGCYRRLDSVWPYHMQEKHKTIISSINGAIAGITATTVTYPLDLMRTVFAGQGIPKQFPTIQSFAMSTFRTRGLVGFYSGLSPTLFQIAPYMGLSFGIYSTLNNITSTHRSEPGSIHWILSYFGNGAIAGFISKLAVYPIDTVKKRMQMREMTRDVSYGKIPYYQTSYECFNDIIRRESIRGLYKGTWPGVLKSVITHSSTFASYEVALHLIKRIKHGN